MIRNLISLSTAGGGKTTRLIERIEELKKNGVNDNKILIISFTNATCDDIFKRSGIKAQTIHSFCYKFLNDNYDIVTNPKDIVKIFIHKYFYLENLGIEQVSRLVENYSLNKNFSYNLEFLSEIDQELNKEFKELINDLEEEKNKHNIMFFSDILHKFKDNIDENLVEIGNQYDHILIDETQDLSLLQLQIIYTIISIVFVYQDKSIYVVGDPKQSIYGFQGSDVSYYLEFIDKIKTLFENNIDIEINSKTFRFGGEILRKINSKFEEHKSSIDYGNVIEINLKNHDLIEYIEIILELIKDDYKDEDILFLFSKNSFLINTLQEQLSSRGFKTKVWLKHNTLYECLKDIFNYITTKNLYYKAKILQGPIFNMEEPLFYFIVKNNLENYEKEFFEILEEKSRNVSELIKFLNEKKLFINNIDKTILEELFIISNTYLTLGHFILNLPETITVEYGNLKFSTIHSAKGLESKAVIYINLPESKEKIFINLNPFFFFKNTDNEYTLKLNQENIILKQNQIKNLDYVALTRAKELLFIINLQ